MVKVFGPALSLDASGTIGDAIVFSKWKGRHYVRERIIPSNPRSGLQVGFRSMFQFIAQNWAGVHASNQASYDDLADSLAVSPFNAYVRNNQRRWRNYRPPSWDIDASETGAVLAWNGGTPAAAGGVASITITFTPATINQNWGMAIFRSDTTGFTPAISNCVAVVLANTLATLTWVDTPLAVGAWFYDTRRFTDSGLWGALDGEITASAT